MGGIVFIYVFCDTLLFVVAFFMDIFKCLRLVKNEECKDVDNARVDLKECQ